MTQAHTHYAIVAYAFDLMFSRNLSENRSFTLLAIWPWILVVRKDRKSAKEKNFFAGLAFMSLEKSYGRVDREVLLDLVEIHGIWESLGCMCEADWEREQAFQIGL